MHNQKTYPTFTETLVTSLLIMAVAGITSPGIAKAGAGAEFNVGSQQQSVISQPVFEKPLYQKEGAGQPSEVPSEVQSQQPDAQPEIPIQQSVTQPEISSQRPVLKRQRYSPPPKYRVVIDPREAENLFCYMKTSDGRTLDLKEFCAMTENTVKK